MRIQENGKVPSPPEATKPSKIEGINTISSILYDDIPEMTATICLTNGKVLDELVSWSNDNQVKQDDNSTQQHNNAANDTTISTYKPTILFPQRLRIRKSMLFMPKI